MIIPFRSVVRIGCNFFLMRTDRLLRIAAEARINVVDVSLPNAVMIDYLLIPYRKSSDIGGNIGDIELPSSCWGLDARDLWNLCRGSNGRNPLITLFRWLSNLR